MRNVMISDQDQKAIYAWATNPKASITPVFVAGDKLKGIGAGKTLAIITPSHLMHKINYKKLLNDPNIHTMGVNCCYLIPGCEKLTYYLPFTTANKTCTKNNDKTYQNWIRNYKGLVMHGMHFNDGTNAVSPYFLATPNEVKDIIKKCPKTKFMVWHHAWGDYVKLKGGWPGMVEHPHFDKWTPRRLPWAHCGAICGFAIPMGMALGYSKIYVVGMGYRYVTKGYHNTPKDLKQSDQGKAYDSWLQFAPKRMPNQAALAVKHNILLKVGPKNLTEPELKKFYQTFDTIEEIK